MKYTRAMVFSGLLRHDGMTILYPSDHVWGIQKTSEITESGWMVVCASKGRSVCVENSANANSVLRRLHVNMEQDYGKTNKR